MSTTDRVDAFQRRHPVLGFPLAVFYKFFDDFGAYLASLLSYYSLISLFPALLLASTGLSWILRDRPDWQQRLLDTALADFPVVGEQLRAPAALEGGPVAITIGALVATYGALGVAQALQYAANVIWQIPRNSRPNPFTSRGRSFLLVLVVGFGLLSTSALSIYLQRWFPGTMGWWVHFLMSIALTAAVFLIVFQLATARRMRMSNLWAGAIFTGVGWEVMRRYGTPVIAQVVERTSEINQLFAFLVGILVFVYLVAMIVVLGMEVDVVRSRKLYPRALLTPFTDAVDLTDADKRSYAGQARSMRTKGYERIEVHFDPRDDDLRGWKRPPSPPD